MSKTKLLLIQIAVCLALGTVMGIAFWWFDGGRTYDGLVGHPNAQEAASAKVYQGKWHKDYLEVIK